ncbi:MAG: MmgE/PrpD family protein, partial [Desulfovibrio sp.]|nr:MmgE/PrpD family protein [Desulfovibrio sp.]
IGFAAALALVKGQPSIADFSAQMAQDPRIQATFRKIQFVEDPAYDSAVNNVRGAAMDIVTTRGTFSVRVPLPVGEPENPAPKDRYATKFHDLASGVLD